MPLMVGSGAEVDGYSAWGLALASSSLIIFFQRFISSMSMTISSSHIDVIVTLPH